MKLLLDQGLPHTAAELLTTAGIDTTHVGEIGYASAEDPAGNRAIALPAAWGLPFHRPAHTRRPAAKHCRS